MLPPACQEETRQSPSGDWVKNPIVAEWSGRVMAKRVTPDELARAVRACGMLRSSPTCFVGQPFHVWMRMPSWLPGETAVAVPKLLGLGAAKARENTMGMGGCGNAMAAQEREEAFQKIGVLPVGTTMVVFTVTLGPSEFFDGPKMTQTFDVPVPVTLIQAAAPKPVSDPDITALVRKAVGFSCSNGYFNEGPSAWVNTWFNRPLNGPLTETLVSLQTEILKDGRVVATHINADPDEVYGEAAWDFSPDQFMRGDVAREVIERKGIEHFEVRITGVLPMTKDTVPIPANHWWRTQYWSGSFTVPLKDILEPESGMRPAGLCGPEGTK